MPTKKISAIIFTFAASLAIWGNLWAQNIHQTDKTLAKATPFGVEIGKTTCRQAATLLKVTEPDPDLKLNSAPASVSKRGLEGLLGSLFKVDCQEGADAPVTEAEFVFLGKVDDYKTLASDLMEKYKPSGNRVIELGGVKGALEFQARNGNVILFPSQKTYQPAPMEILLNLHYYALGGLDAVRNLEQQRKNESQTTEQAAKKARQDRL